MKIFVTIVGGFDNQLGYLQSNEIFSTCMTKDLKQMTFVKHGNRLIGHINFHKKKSNDFVSELVKEIFNTYFVTNYSVYPLYDYHNWVQKFQFDFVNCIFYYFLFVH